ncbi:FAD dependent oxidoreductase [Annulohypoxylon maeteangense]|uniref:FAD dependent oxidoreductase n=1 Tax=Annulohypoxylon maeteangense TaxID=1927788 RepID=UPI0020078889|nr:FAD dependent oxidoreductase [Annulohypoxylon maeteangense]KAI0883925.1 FAD dependent oxidoreductase [Annulohypoxylon maeteangense]
MAQPSYIIIGAGVFGTSTALHLITQFPSASVTLIDRNAPSDATRVAASWDWNKVVRADYRDPLYCKLALDAQDVWRSDPLWAPFYHQSGIYWISQSGFAGEVIENYRRLGRDTSALKELEVEVAKGEFGGLFDQADYTGVKKVLVNRSSGWADAKGALRRVAERAVELGVRFVRGEVQELLFGEGGACVGVLTKEGVRVQATHTILSTGAFTPKFLDGVATATGNDAFLAGERMLAGGVTTGLAKLDDETAKVFADMPVCIQENPPERGPDNGTLPLTADNKLKWWGQTIFRNTQTMPSGRQISAPPTPSDYDQWKVPDVLVEDVAVANKVTFGKRGEGWEIKEHRICWDVFTPSADFIISPHSAAKGLYVATAGSFHGFKFFPIIGSYVVKMLEGTLDPDLVKTWAWDRELPDESKRRIWPHTEFKDLL